MRVRAVVAYDGTDYHGFQRQSPEREPSIQGSLEQALAAIGQPGVTVVGSGRTDAGVHAEGQVIAFDVEWAHGCATLQRALNASLPPAIVVLDLQPTSPEFHPRYDARSREYVYTVYNAPTRHPLWSRYSWHVPGELDIAPMQAACQAFLGEHDFAAFGLPTGHRPGESTLRQVYHISCGPQPSPAGRAAGDQTGEHCMCVRVNASGFLYHMVRTLVGTLVAVGQGVVDVHSVVDILESRDRARVRWMAPPQGLCLTHVSY